MRHVLARCGGAIGLIHLFLQIPFWQYFGPEWKSTEPYIDIAEADRAKISAARAAERAYDYPPLADGPGHILNDNPIDTLIA